MNKFRIFDGLNECWFPRIGRWIIGEENKFPVARCRTRSLARILAKHLNDKDLSREFNKIMRSYRK